MSFSSEVKDELYKQISAARHCQMAELSAIMNFCGNYGQDKNGRYTIGFNTENEALVRKGFTLLKKSFNIDTENGSNEQEIKAVLAKFGNLDEPVSPLLIKSSCCQRSFLRGAFLSIGSMSDPEKGYHLEFDCTNEAKAVQLKNLIQGFDIEAKIILRKKYYVVYLKEGAGIVDILNVMEAHLSLMELENLRIVKDMRNSINRRVNCETANISKTVNAASRQIEDIELLQRRYGLNNLPDNLREIALLRLEYPDATLKELGESLDPKVGKSGVNHRLRKLSELANEIKS
ncbi:DNA-binding protein WhiA [Lachnospiraceae bacterium OttesenSCG-928-D06]|nr:DNA-binding protein WhiA [Lachnospiraceae bacterium OttesenSCG-928-D06]